MRAERLGGIGATDMPGRARKKNAASGALWIVGSAAALPSRRTTRSQLRSLVRFRLAQSIR